MLSKSTTKYIQTLGHKKFREQDQLFIAEGPKLLNELLAASDVYITEIYAVQEWIREYGHTLTGISVTEISARELEKISQLSTPNKVLALVKQFPVRDLTITANGIVLVLDTIQDPGNLGTIIRIADWFGISHLVCSEDCADRYNPKVVQSTMGSIARVNLFYTHPEEWLSRHKEIPVYATALHGGDITLMKKITTGIIIIGNESKGISPSLLNLADHKITIPKKGLAESLNAAVATGIILSHLV